MVKAANIYVRRRTDKTIVGQIEVSRPRNARCRERAVNRLFRELNHRDFYLDTDELNAADRSD